MQETRHETPCENKQGIHISEMRSGCVLWDVLLLWLFLLGSQQHFLLQETCPTCVLANMVPLLAWIIPGGLVIHEASQSRARATELGGCGARVSVHCTVAAAARTCRGRGTDTSACAETPHPAA